LESNSNKAGSSDGNNDNDTNTDTESDRQHHEDLWLQVGAKFRFVQDHMTIWNFGAVHPFTGGLSGLRIQEVPHVNKGSTQITFSSSSWK
jgi:hypothetical protein